MSIGKIKLNIKTSYIQIYKYFARENFLIIIMHQRSENHGTRIGATNWMHAGMFSSHHLHHPIVGHNKVG